jgi:hypothetical protein
MARAPYIDADAAPPARVPTAGRTDTVPPLPGGALRATTG